MLWANQTDRSSCGYGLIWLNLWCNNVHRLSDSWMRVMLCSEIWSAWCCSQCSDVMWCFRETGKCKSWGAWGDTVRDGSEAETTWGAWYGESSAEPYTFLGWPEVECWQYVHSCCCRCILLYKVNYFPFCNVYESVEWPSCSNELSFFWRLQTLYLLLLLLCCFYCFRHNTCSNLAACNDSIFPSELRCVQQFFLFFF